MIVAPFDAIYLTPAAVAEYTNLVPASRRTPTEGLQRPGVP
jgi:hypothetical protein